jgi:thiosulfate dehydrogenase [quinone] large subunit
MPALNAPTQSLERLMLFAIRVCVGWVFLWAAIHHFGNATYVHGFLANTKTFHPIYGRLAASAALLPLISFLVEYGHLLIGLSLVTGLFVRASAPFGILLMLLYWTAHMDFPFIEDSNNLLLDYHITYAFCLGLCMLRHAGHVWGLDGMVANWRMAQEHKTLRWLTA